MEYQCNQWSAEEKEGGFGAFSAGNSAKNSAKFPPELKISPEWRLDWLTQLLLETWTWTERLFALQFTSDRVELFRATG